MKAVPNTLRKVGIQLIKNAANAEEKARIRRALDAARSAAKRDQVRGTASIDEKLELQHEA